MLPRRGESGDRPAAHFPAGFRSLLTEAPIDRGLPALDVPLLLEQSGVQLGEALISLGNPAFQTLDVRLRDDDFSGLSPVLGLRRLQRLCSHVGGDCRLRPFELLLVGSLVSTEIPPLLFEGASPLQT